MQIAVVVKLGNKRKLRGTVNTNTIDLDIFSAKGY